MINNFCFVINEEDEAFELWVNGECITDCFYLKGEEAELMYQLARFANVPCYERKKLSFEEVHKKMLDK
jgi:hypothetical protein